MAEPYLGEIILFAGTYAPKNWAYCNGQLLSINQNTALYSLLGTTYGGDGVTTFALPNLQGRVPVHAGNLPGGGSYTLGQMAGTENVTLTINQMPAHTHVAIGNAQASSNAADQGNPVGNIPAAAAARGNPSNYTSPSNANGNLGGNGPTLSVTGGSQPVSVLQPYCVLNYIIALVGVYPPRP